MDVTNDPRFFEDNVINQRLAAFGGLAVISGLLVQNAMDNICDMNKRMYKLYAGGDLSVWDHGLTFVSFLVLLIVFVANMLAVYVGVAQPYHTIRLVTAGPQGFEAASAYYLNKDITAWRHLAIKGMLVALPLYVLQLGLRLMVKFDRQTRADPTLPPTTPDSVHWLGVGFGGFLIAYGIWLFHVHRKHTEIFRNRYEKLGHHADIQAEMTRMMAPRMEAQRNNRNYNGWLDV